MAKIRKKQRSFLRAALGLSALIAVVALATHRLTRNQNQQLNAPEEVTVSQQHVDETTVPPLEVVEEPVSALFDGPQLQSVIDQWAGDSPGAASVVVTDESGTLIASHNAEQRYFAASIYKLYVAYFGYQQVDSGLVDLDEVYQAGRTRGECLDLMIRESDSPCAEKLWVELGKQELTDKLVALGITHTSMIDLTTTAGDVARMLAVIAQGAGLSEASQRAFLVSAKDQIYRDALNAGFSSNVTVYNKIGFRDFDEYHDTAVVELADGRRFILSVLTNGVGTRHIAELAHHIESIVQN